MRDRLDLEAVRRALGGRVWNGGRRWIGPGPGHSRRDASLSVRITDDGEALIHSFAGDSFADCARHLGLEPGPSARAPRHAPRAASRRAPARVPALDPARLAEEARGLAFRTAAWAGRRPMGDTPVDDYLGRRGLPGPFPEDLAFHPDAAFRYDGGERAPAMMALARDGDGRPCGLHLTALAAGPKGRARRMFGRMAGAAVRLGPTRPDPLCLDRPGGGDALAVAEGIETALSFAELYGVACWAALSAPGLAAFQPPPGLSRLVIAADGDPAGRDAALALAERASRTCVVEISAAPDGRDWNDVLLSEMFGVKP